MSITSKQKLLTFALVMGNAPFMAQAQTITISDASTTQQTVSNGGTLDILTSGSVTVSNAPVRASGATSDGFLINNAGGIAATNARSGVAIDLKDVSGGNAEVNRVLNYGTITGQRYEAIVAEGDAKVSIINHGTVTSNSGTDFWATIKIGDDSSIMNYGNIFQMGSGGQAVELNGRNSSLTIGEGSRIIGALKTGHSSNTLILDVGSAQSYVFSTTGNWTLQDRDGRAVVEGSVMAAGIGNVETADELMFDRAFNLDTSLTRLERQVVFGDSRALFDAYGMSQSRDDNGTTSAYEVESRGMTVGLPIEAMGRSAVAFLNFHDSQLDIATGTHEIEAQSFRIGLSAPEVWAGETYSVGLYALAGRNSYDGTRGVLVNQDTTTGITTVDAAWDSSEFMVGIDASTRYELSEQMSLDSSFGLASQVEQVGAYSEQNYFAWDARTIVQAHAKAEVTLGYQASDRTQIFGTAGAWRRTVLSGEVADYTINDTAVSYDGGVFRGTMSSLRIGVGHRLANGATLSAEATALHSSIADSSWGAGIGVAARF